MPKACPPGRTAVDKATPCPPYWLQEMQAHCRDSPPKARIASKPAPTRASAHALFLPGYNQPFVGARLRAIFVPAGR